MTIYHQKLALSPIAAVLDCFTLTCRKYSETFPILVPM